MSNNQPTLHAFTVEEGNGDRAFWTRIGALWPHKDGEGFNLKLDHYPARGQDIVLRKPLPPKEGNDANE